MFENGLGGSREESEKQPANLTSCLYFCKAYIVQYRQILCILGKLPFLIIYIKYKDYLLIVETVGGETLLWEGDGKALRQRTYVHQDGGDSNEYFRHHNACDEHSKLSFFHLRSHHSCQENF